MRFMIWIILFIYSCTPSVMAEGQVKIVQNQSIELSENANNPSPDNNNRFELPNKSSIIQNVKPIDLDKAAKKVEEKGEKAYKILQSGSIPYFVVVLAISFFFLFLGLFIKKLIIVGVGGLFLALFSFIFINFAPEITQVFLQTFQDLFNS